jgi:membrane-bound ClpP family serine protease
VVELLALLALAASCTSRTIGENASEKSGRPARPAGVSGRAWPFAWSLPDPEPDRPGPAAEQALPPDRASAGWAHRLAEFVRRPWVGVLLVLLAIACLLIEMRVPGVGIPGVVAAVCFVLFFWAHARVHGLKVWWALPVFVVGSTLLALEVSGRLPWIRRFRVGVLGALLVLVSTSLISAGSWPHTTDEWFRFGQELGLFSLSLFGGLLAAEAVSRVRTWMNRPGERPAESTPPPRPAVPADLDLTDLQGAIGVAVTALRPGGKGQFGELFVDVVHVAGTELPAGTRLQVVRIDQGQILVRNV